ncbi:MMPL family transporter [Nocardioides dubius]|uniref:MMPL family transporter n=1 Tax=Nocardioides dubius TaxID=317019 RepID=UPI0031DBCDE0
MIGVWVVAAVAIALTAPALKTTSDQSEFLPSHYESIRAAQAQTDHFPEANSTPGAIVLFQREDGGKITAADQEAVAQIATDLGPTLGEKTFVQTMVTSTGDQPNVSQDGTVMLGIVPLAKDATGYDPQAFDDAKEMRDELDTLIADTGLTAQTTGTVPQGLDSQESSEQALAIVGIATIVLIVLLLALIFRSVIICLMPIVIVGLVSIVATGLIGFANEAFDLKADSSIQTILVVVLYGIGTDYILFFLFRYRERLRHGADVKASVRYGLERAGEAITSAGGAVIVAFLALLLSSLGIFRAIGPALAIAVFVTMIAVLTLVPAVVTLLGRALFWPSKKWKLEPEAARFSKVGHSLGRRPGTFAAVSGLLMLLLAGFSLGFNPSFDFNSSLPKNVESTEAMETFQDHFAAGQADPAPVLLVAKDGQLDPAELPAFQQALEAAEGVDSVQPAQVSEDGEAAVFSVILTHDPVSDEALNDVKGPIRTAAHDAAPDGTSAMVGGTASIFADMQKAMNRDYSVVFPVAAAIILLILMLLLRSLVAPWYLMAAVGLGFAATLGATVIVFQHIQGESGLIFMLPIYIYLFVTALGTDYNILMIARLREEAREGRNPRDAAAEAVKHAGPTIAAAGVILAGTFASLMLAGNSLMVSMGFALSVGIAVAAFVMAMFFTPALTALIGHAAWWPGHGDEKKPDDEPEDEPALV